MSFFNLFTLQSHRFYHLGLNCVELMLLILELSVIRGQRTFSLQVMRLTLPPITVRLFHFQYEYDHPQQLQSYCVQLQPLQQVFRHQQLQSQSLYVRLHWQLLFKFWLTQLSLPILLLLLALCRLSDLKFIFQYEDAQPPSPFEFV